MALRENNGYFVSPRDVLNSWAMFLHITKSPPPPAEVIFLETGIAPEGSGTVKRRPLHELDMRDQPVEGQLYLWHEEDGSNLPLELREVVIFTPYAPEAVTDLPVTRAEVPRRQPAHLSANLVLGL